MRVGLVFGKLRQIRFLRTDLYSVPFQPSSFPFPMNCCNLDLTSTVWTGHYIVAFAIPFAATDNVFGSHAEALLGCPLGRLVNRLSRNWVHYVVWLRGPGGMPLPFEASPCPRCTWMLSVKLRLRSMPSSVQNVRIDWTRFEAHLFFQKRVPVWFSFQRCVFFETLFFVDHRFSRWRGISLDSPRQAQIAWFAFLSLASSS